MITRQKKAPFLLVGKGNLVGFPTLSPLQPSEIHENLIFHSTYSLWLLCHAFCETFPSQWDFSFSDGCCAPCITYSQLITPAFAKPHHFPRRKTMLFSLFYTFFISRYSPVQRKSFTNSSNTNVTNNFFKGITNKKKIKIGIKHLSFSQSSYIEDI